MFQSDQPRSTPFGNNCTCREMLQTVLDGEASQEQIAYFRQHMDLCQPCFKNYSIDAAIQELLKSKCCGQNAPPDLIEKIRTQIILNR